MSEGYLLKVQNLDIFPVPFSLSQRAVCLDGQGIPSPDRADRKFPYPAPLQCIARQPCEANKQPSSGSKGGRFGRLKYLKSFARTMLLSPVSCWEPWSASMQLWPLLMKMIIPKTSDIDFDHFLQESMSQHKSRFLEFEASVGEIQDNMKSILGKVIIRTFNYWLSELGVFNLIQLYCAGRHSDWDVWGSWGEDQCTSGNSWLFQRKVLLYLEKKLFSKFTLFHRRL